MRILVCGGRDFIDRGLLNSTLDRLRIADLVECIIEGDANGVDRMAGEWARRYGISNKKYPAQWQNGKSAGPERNQLMLDEGKPDLVIAFPTRRSRGTWDMVERARRARVKVHVVQRSD